MQSRKYSTQDIDWIIRMFRDGGHGKVSVSEVEGMEKLLVVLMHYEPMSEHDITEEVSRHFEKRNGGNTNS
jgi:hypothetical protein